MIRSLLDRLKTYIACEVPTEMAACEFDCRKLECDAQEWVNCPNRLRKKEALEQLSE